MSGRRLHDVMQVCLGGHCINASFKMRPEFNKAFCSDCGEPTIIGCLKCAAPIRGRLDGVVSFEALPPTLPPPAFCEACGAAFPWQVARVANAVALLRLEGVPDAEVLEIERNLPDITRDTPRSQVAATIVRNLLKKVAKPVYEVSIKVVGDVAAATAKSHLGL